MSTLATTTTNQSALTVMAQRLQCDAAKLLEDLRAVLNYDPQTGIFSWRKQTGQRGRIGQAAGSKTDEGYIAIKLNARTHKAHRLAWLLHYGALPKENIDHINRVKDDNRIANLRLASNAENCRNSTKRVTNKSGYKGVCWHKNKKRWRAQICHNYNVLWIGDFNTPEAAHNAYQKKALELQGAFAHTN